MQALQDSEFGAITVRKLGNARRVTLKVDHRGIISVTMPQRAPLYAARQLLDQSRDYLRQTLSAIHQRQVVLLEGSLIGKTHRLVLLQGSAYASRLHGTTLEVTLPQTMAAEEKEAQQFIKQEALKALRTQAKAYLPRRLDALAAQHGFAYHKIRFSNAGTRWGSCSTSGTISLNIWLMQLSFELIDYVIVHELCHTRHMNHSPRFWAEVSGILPNYKELRRLLKSQQAYA